MPRPPKYRRVEFEPQFTYFKPSGVPRWQLKEVVLSVEEIETLRLKDMEGLEQEECAERMHVSRPTFQRILIGARKKIAEALIKGNAIRIEGGNYRLANRYFRCVSCNYEMEIPHGMSPGMSPGMGPGMGRGMGHGMGRGSGFVCPRCGGALRRI